MKKSLIIGHFDPLTIMAQDYIEFLNGKHNHSDILLLSTSKKFEGIRNLYAVKNTFAKNQVYWRDCFDKITPQYVLDTIDIVMGKSYDKIFDLDTGVGFEPSPLTPIDIYQDVAGYWSQITREYQKLLRRRAAILGHSSLADTLFYENCPYVDLQLMNEEQKTHFQFHSCQSPLVFCDVADPQRSLYYSYITDLYVFLEDNNKDHKDYSELKNQLQNKKHNFVTVNISDMDLFNCVNTVKQRVNVVARELRWF